jgi:hypothetical protein
VEIVCAGTTYEAAVTGMTGAVNTAWLMGGGGGGGCFCGEATCAGMAAGRGSSGGGGGGISTGLAGAVKGA